MRNVGPFAHFEQPIAQRLGCGLSFSPPPFQSCLFFLEFLLARLGLGANLTDRCFRRFSRFMYRTFSFSLRVLVPSSYGDRKKLTLAIHHQYLSVFPDHDSRERVLHALAKSLNGSAAYFDHEVNLQRVQRALFSTVPRTKPERFATTRDLCPLAGAGSGHAARSL